MKRVVISGYYGFDNAGDEAVLISIISALKFLEKNLEIVVLSAVPEITSRDYSVQAVSRTNYAKVIKEIIKCDLFISGGGSLLQDTTGWKSIPYYGGLLYFASLIGKKTAVYAQGIGPVETKVNQKLIKKIFKKVDFISVRDRLSKRLLEDIGTDREDIIVTADPAFLLKGLGDKKDSSIEIENIIDTEINQSSPLIGISVRPWKNNNYLDKLIPVIEEITEATGGRAVIIPLFYQEDFDVSSRLSSKLSGVTLIDKKLKTLDILKIFSKFDLFIGIRLHSLIFAAVHNVPLVGINYDPKVEGFLSNLALNSSVNIDDFEADTLLRITETVWENRGRFSKVLKNSGDVFYKKALYNAAAVLKLIE